MDEGGEWEDAQLHVARDTDKVIGLPCILTYRGRPFFRLVSDRGQSTEPSCTK